MSTAQFQAALVKLIRYPELNRGDKAEAFLQGYDLTSKEQWQLRSLASSYYVGKFGRDQRATRFDLNGLGTLPLTVKVVGRKKMACDIYGILFEPTSEGLQTQEIAKSFAKFFIERSPALINVLGLPEFITDLARYEFAEYFMKGPEAPLNWQPSLNSLLRPDVPLMMERYRYDMVSYTEKAKPLEESELQKLSAEKRDVIVLFARIPDDENGFLLKQFEIDESLASFLQGQINTNSSELSALPTYYEDLVGLQICRPSS